jgi:hypothetical protein
MLDNYIGGWLAMTGAYFSAPLALVAGEVNALTVVATAGILLLVAGLAVAIVQKVGRVGPLSQLAVFTALAPIVIIFTEHTLGWFGRLLVCAFGVGAILIAIGVISPRCHPD